MLRGLVRIVLFIVLVVAVAAVAGVFALGYRPGTHGFFNRPATPTSRHLIDPATARARGAELGEQFATMANAAGDALSDGAITAKIKSKMALDDSLRSRDIQVSTTDAVVTLSGRVGSAAEHDRAMQLARETEGVKSVTDKLEVASGK